MPYITDNKKLASQFLDRRVRLLDCQKNMVKHYYGLGVSITSLSKMFDVNKRLIQFILFPERKEKNLEHREERGGWKQYYKKDYHAEKMRDHRKYKYNVLKDVKY